MSNVPVRLCKPLASGTLTCALPFQWQPRRTTRATRHTNKDAENANTHPSRISTRSKTIAVPIPQDARTTRATAPTLASKAKTIGTAINPIGKRKREVLVEVTGVTNNNEKKGGGTAKGKGKAEEIGEGAGPKLRPASKHARESLRTLAGPIARRTLRTASASTTSTQTTDEILRNDVIKETAAAVDQRTSSFNQIPPRPPSTQLTSALDDAEVGRAFKRRHTQSPAITSGIQDDSQADADKIAAELANIDEESEGKPQLWDDLDEGDWDDPTMVSEYVAEVCVYLKEIEVCIILPRRIRGE
jgi:G2/mitotic-specific cyclin 2